MKGDKIMKSTINHIGEEKYIKKVANEYKYKIPNNLYNALCNYKVEITD